MIADDQIMPKRVILITGTPSVGKTTAAKLLVTQLNGFYVNLTELAIKENLIVGKDEDRDSIIIDETMMKPKIREIVEGQNKDVIIDGHYAPNVVPEELITYVFVLRRDPVELRKLMEKSGMSGRKLWENLASEILDVCLVDALDAVDVSKVCELDISGKRVAETVFEISAVLNGEKKCQVGIVDWLGKLESEGLLDECLKI
jgi:broad-specificity NMP kinase